MKNSKFSFHPGAALSDRDIKRAIKEGIIEIKSPKPLEIQPSSIDVHLSRNILVFSRRRVEGSVIDLKKPVDSFMDYEVIDPKKGAVVHPKEFILGVTEEWLKLPDNIAMNVDGKSSLGRLGLVIHATAGFVDPGWTGHITLEITNFTDLPLIIYPGMPIGQFRFTLLSSPAEHVYGDKKLKSKYKNTYDKDARPMASQYWKNLIKK